jgi:hypothetical protein
MSYATLMVHVDVVGEMGAHVKVAGELAKRFHAHLIGISGWAHRLERYPRGSPDRC